MLELKRLLLILLLIFAAGPARALDCRVVMVKNDGVKRFLSYVVTSAERFKATGKMSTFGWLRVWLKEQELRADDLDLLEGCFARNPGIDPVKCAPALDASSVQMFLMIQDTKDARDCEFTKMPPADQQAIGNMIEKAEQFHLRLLEKFHDLDWKRAMQRAERDTETDLLP